MVPNHPVQLDTATENLPMEVQYALPLSELIARVENEPELKFIYSGIKENSVGTVFGPSKSGKTMFCENLGMAIAAGMDSYLGMPINIDNRKVLIISFEEHYRSRTERNIKQISKLQAAHGTEWISNYIVASENMPMYLATPKDWQIVEDVIEKHAPGLVILDSITRMSENIEESKSAQEFTKKLRKMAQKTNSTVIAIHHTHKMYGQQLSIDTIAGSRVIAQELDFMIGINRTMDGKRYMKDVAFRYAPCDSEAVRTFDIDEKCWLNLIGQADEVKLLAALDGRVDETNRIKVLEFIQQQIDAGSESVTTRELETYFLDTKKMSKGTLYTSCLNKLVTEGKIAKIEKGKYKMAA